MNDNENGTPAAVTENSAPEGVNWADLAVDADEGGAFVYEPDGTPSDDDTTLSGAPDDEAPASEGTPEATPPAGETPPTQTPTQGQEQQPPVQQPTPAVQPTEPQQPIPNVNLEELQAKYRQGLEEAYAISQEDALALATAPETVMPKLAANMHLRVMQEVVQHVKAAMQQVPQMMHQQLEQQTAETEAKQAFYGEWPGLEAHHDVVLRNAALFRQANPNATRQQVIEGAGTLTAMALGIDPATVRKGAQAPAAPQVAPRVAAQSARPVKPAAVGSGPGTVPQQVKDFWAQAADEDIDFLRG